MIGSKYYETPNIDKLANTEMHFLEGYATCQACSLSRVSLMTGQFPARHGITDWVGAPTGTQWGKWKKQNMMLPADYRHQLDTKLVTLPEAMKEADYKTFFAGKWHIEKEG